MYSCRMTDASYLRNFKWTEPGPGLLTHEYRKVFPVLQALTQNHTRIPMETAKEPVEWK